MSVSYVHTTYVHKYFRTSANRTPKCIVETSSICCFVPLSLCIPSILSYFLIFRFFLYDEFSIISFFIMSFVVFFLFYFLASLCLFNYFHQSFVLSFDLRRLFGAHLWRAFSLYVSLSSYSVARSILRFHPSRLRGGWPDWLGFEKIRCPNIWTMDRGTCPFSRQKIRSTDHSSVLHPFPNVRSIEISRRVEDRPPLSHSVAHGFASAGLRNSSSFSFDRLSDTITANCDLFLVFRAGT